jgi:hypothetical protein
MNTEKKSSQLSEITNNNISSSRKSRILNFIYDSNNRLLFKDFSEKENNTEKKSYESLKKEIIYKLTSFSQESRNVQFSSRVEEIECDNKDENEIFFEKISKKKNYRTPPKNAKTSYKKTKEHIKTPYKTTKSRSSRNKSKNTKDSNIINCNKSNVSTKSSNYWKTLLENNDNTFLKNFSQEPDDDVNRNCNSVILENPYNNQKEYKNLFLNISLEDNDEEMNKSF